MKIAPFKVLVCAGTGGVGKTTTAAALGEMLARRGQKVLVLTLDPARRLASALGVSNSGEEFRVAIFDKGELWASMIEPVAIFDRFVERVSKTPELAQQLMKNRLYQELTRSLNGSQEFTSLERLLEAYESQKYDVIVLDTPPAQHATEFLRAPERIFALFQDSVTKWFIQSDESQTFMQSLFHRGTQTVLNALKRITGSQFIAELSDFFRCMSALQREVAERSIRAHRLLSHRETGFLLVTGFDEAKLQEAQTFADDLRRGGYHLAGVIVNRTFPDWLTSGDRQQVPAATLVEFKRLYEQMTSYYSRRKQMCDEFANKWKDVAPIIRVPDFYQPINGLDGLHQMSLKLESSGL